MKQCAIPDCNKTVIAKGLCPMHYNRLKRNGTTDKPNKQKPLGKSKGIHIQVSQAEYEAIQEYKKKHGVTGRDLLVRAISVNVRIDT